MAVRNIAALFGNGLSFLLESFLKLEAVHASLCGTAQSPWL